MSILIIIVPLLTALIFFLIVPGVGALIVQSNWRKFRINMLNATNYPYLEYSDIKNENNGVNFRFFGSLEAIEDKNKIWLKGDNLSIAADLENVYVYMLPSLMTDEEAQRVPWKRISSLVAGTQILISGPLTVENNRSIFKNSSSNALLIVIFDGEKETLLKRAISGGRKRNEYWNQFTLISLITGSFSLFSLSYFFFRSPLLEIPALISLCLSFYPIAILMPPGVIFFFLYQYFWKIARHLRIDRDLFRIPLFHFRNNDETSKKKEALLSNGEKYVMLNVNNLEVSNHLEENTSVETRQCSTVKREAENNMFIFGSYSPEADLIVSPKDRMMEFVMIPGDPEKISKKCQKKSIIFTSLSGMFIVLDISINLIIILILLSNYIR